LTSELYSLSMYYKDTLFSFFWIVWLSWLRSPDLLFSTGNRYLQDGGRLAHVQIVVQSAFFIHLRVEGSDVPYQKRIEEGGSRLSRPAPAGGDRDGEGHDGEVSPGTFVLYILWASAIGGSHWPGGGVARAGKDEGVQKQAQPDRMGQAGQGSTMLERTTKYELPASVESSTSMCIMCFA
jgi:hypothetical protein